MPQPRRMVESRPFSRASAGKLRSLRHAVGKTLEQVAAEMGMTSPTLSTLERTSQGVSFKTLHDLADYYGTTVYGCRARSARISPR